MAFRNFTNGFLSTYFNRRMMHQCSHLISFRSITSSSYNVELNIDTPETMEEVGGVISSVTKPGDIVFLDGDLGAGKTCFSRGFIRTRSGVSDLRVTSPTYLLCNTYPSYDDVPMYVLFTLILYMYMLFFYRMTLLVQNFIQSKTPYGSVSII